MKIDLRPKSVIAAIKKHKTRTAVMAAVMAIAVFGGIRMWGGNETETKYVLAAVEKGTMITSVTGSGTVSASSQVELTPKVSGDVTYVGVKVGDEVKKGTLIAQLDAKEAQKSVRDAEIALRSAEIAYDKLVKPADQLSLIQAENNISKSEESVSKTYEDGYDAVSNNFLNLPSVMTGLKDILHGKTIGGFEQENHDAYENIVYSYAADVRSYEGSALEKYDIAYDAYTKNLEEYKSSDRFGERKDTKTLIEDTYRTTKAISDAVKSTNDFLTFVKEKMNEIGIATPTFLITDLANLATYTTKTATNASALLSAKTAITSAELSLEENSQKLADLEGGADDLDVASQKLSLETRKNALADAKEKLDNYYIRAPFDGVIAQMNIESSGSISSDSVSSGSAIATIVTRQKIAEISLNEVDITKVKTGQKATLTFDAVEDLTITGEVAEVDAIGTNSQGVVSYSAKIAFDTQDDRIRSGMSVSATIMTEVKQDVLVIDNSALKSQGDTYYVEVVDGLPSDSVLDPKGMSLSTPPSKIAVEVGLENDDKAEISSGLSEGDIVVIKTTSGTGKTSSSSNKKDTSSAPTILSGGGQMGPGGGSMMIVK